MKYLYTIDREEWAPTKRFRVWKKDWWLQRLNPLTDEKSIGRIVFELDTESGKSREVFRVPQKLLEAEFSQEDWAKASKSHDGIQKSLARGLRAITKLENGHYVVNDIFGIYEIDASGAVLRYLTKPFFADMHSVLPNKNNDRLLVTSTAKEEVLEIDWEGNVSWSLSLPELFDLKPSTEVEKFCKQYKDLRMMPLNMRRELFHINWAQWIDEGSRMLVSLCQPGQVAILEKQGNCWRIEKSWSLFPHCHGPSIDAKRGTFIVSVSRTNQVKEVDMESGRSIWTADNISFGKRSGFIDENRAFAGDCNQKRIVELDRNTGNLLREFKLPGIPYDVNLVTN